MVASTDIKFYVHTNDNAPQLTDSWGALVNVLDACLITGYNAPNILSASITAENILNLSFNGSHNLLAGQVLLISGADQSEFNQQFRIANIPTNNTVQIDIDSSFPAIITGTLSATVPSIGWVKEFESGGKRAYRNANTDKTDRPFLRVVDEKDTVWDATYAKYAKVGIVDQMLNIDTMGGTQTPYDAEKPDKNWVGISSGAGAINGWAKWYYSRIKDIYVDNYFDSEGTVSVNKRWLIVGNGSWFYILPSQVDSIYPNVYFFGECETGLGNIYGLSSSLQYDQAQNNKATNTKTALSSGAEAFLLHTGEASGIRALGMQSGKNDGPGGNPLNYENISINLVASDVYISRKYNNNVYRTVMPALKWLMNPYDLSYELKTIEDGKEAYLLKTVFASTLTSSLNTPLSISGLIGFKLY